MFKLYANVAYTWQKLDIAVDKKKVVNTMIDFSNKFNHYYFMIIERENGTDKNIEVTRSEEDFKQYLQNFKSTIQPLEDMSCVDLKKYILTKKDSRKN